MCGIAGIVAHGNERLDFAWLGAMAESIAHRGPDDERFLIIDSGRGKEYLFRRDEPPDSAGDVGFAHRRLSIIDLSESASQPMSDETGQVWIVYNGEIFNYLEIRKDLIRLGHRFQTQSDTEVILEAYLEWGRDCLRRFNGMWAFVIYDFRTARLFGARDRFGIKPFFYHLSSQFFSFASEIKALLKLPWVERKPFFPAIKDYLYYSRVDTSRYTFFSGIHELEPGQYFDIDMRPSSGSLYPHGGSSRRTLTRFPGRQMRFRKNSGTFFFPPSGCDCGAMSLSGPAFPEGWTARRSSRWPTLSRGRAPEDIFDRSSGIPLRRISLCR